MRGSTVVVFACVLFCAFAFGGFAYSAQPETPAKVVLSPKDPAVIIGKTQTSTQAFTATVFDAKGAKITTPVALTWTLDQVATDDGCSIDQNGVLSVPDSALIGTFAKSVTAAVTATPAISGTAGFSVIDTPFTGGVFIGTMSCTKGTCNGDTYDLAMDALPGSFTGLLIDNTVKTDFIEFTGKIVKDSSVSATFKNTADNSTITLTGTLGYPDGIASGMSGTWLSSKNGNGGTWTTSLAATAGAGGKVGTWEITATRTPKAAGLTGPFAAIFADDGTTVAGVALIKENGQLVYGISVPGTWTGDDVSSDTVSFPSFAEGGADTNASTNATGTYVPAHKAATGNMLNAGGDVVGTWKLSDIK
ncbi:MAG: hypothetical protein ACLQVJ_24120 [Syntrophobacteraceae bacterium]